MLIVKRGEGFKLQIVAVPNGHVRSIGSWDLVVLAAQTVRMLGAQTMEAPIWLEN